MAHTGWRHNSVKSKQDQRIAEIDESDSNRGMETTKNKIKESKKSQSRKSTREINVVLTGPFSHWVRWVTRVGGIFEKKEGNKKKIHHLFKYIFG